jgi:hypothetical protein
MEWMPKEENDWDDEWLARHGDDAAIMTTPGSSGISIIIATTLGEAMRSIAHHHVPFTYGQTVVNGAQAHFLEVVNA